MLVPILLKFALLPQFLAVTLDTVATKLNNAEKYEEEYEHPIWKEYKANPIGGHDGIDWLVYNAFIESVREDITPPIDTYDTATLMCISCLSEQSIAAGGAPVAVPDFTSGKSVTSAII